MSKGLIRGGESTSHDSGNDILYTIKETGKQVLIEGDEYHFCKAALMSNEIHEYKNKTNKQILDDIYTRSSCMVKEGEAHLGDFIVCKLVVRDKKKRNLTGTNSEILSLMQKEHGCKVVNEEDYKKMKQGFLSKTPAPKKERIYGSKTNSKGSSKSGEYAKSIKFGKSTLNAIANKIEEHNQKYPSKKIKLETAKAVVRRGMGAYSSTHRPTIKGGKPNNRVAWGLARLNSFIYKVANGKPKSKKYIQDDDLLDEVIYKDGGLVEGEILLAPNGKPSNLTSKQWHLVRTPEFKAWFGDWENDPENASKVVDENGEPKPLYHETNAKWFEYDKSKAKAGKFDSGTPNGIFLKSSDKNIGVGSKQMNLFSSIKNPIYARNRESLERLFRLNIKKYSEIKDKLYRIDIEYGKKVDEENKNMTERLKKERENFKGDIPSPEWSKIVEESGEEVNKIIDNWVIETDSLSLEAKKLIDNYISTSSEYDGVFLLSDKGSWGRETDAIIAINPNQIKLATGENTTFDSNNPDIRYEKGGAVGTTWQMPSQKIYEYAEKIRKDYPEIWNMGGNIFGNEAYKNLEKVIKRGYWKPEEEWMYKKWQAFIARHEADFRIAGIIANLKWLNWVEKGKEYSQSIINQEIKKIKKMGNGGELVDEFENFLRKDLAYKLYGGNTFFKKFNYNGDTYRIDFLIVRDGDKIVSANVLVFKEIGSDDNLVLDLPYNLEPDTFNIDVTEYYKMFGSPKIMEKGGQILDSENSSYPNLVIPNSYFIPQSIKNQIIKKSIPKKKYNFPFNYTLDDAARIFENIILKDDLRPNLNAFYLIGDAIACSDGHKIIFIGMAKKQYGAHWFGYAKPDEQHNWVKNVDNEEHAFYKVIPLLKNDYKHQGSINIHTLYQYITFIIDNNLVNKSSYMLKVKYKNAFGGKDWIGVNVTFLKDILDIYLKFGISNINIYASKSNKAILLSKNKLDNKKEIYKQLKDNIFSLLMPMDLGIEPDKWATQDLDLKFSCGIYYDLSEGKTFDILGNPDDIVSEKSILSESEFQLTSDSFRRIFNNKKKQYGKYILENIYPSFIKDFADEKQLEDKKYSEMSTKNLKLATSLCWCKNFLLR